MPEICTMMFEV